MDKLIYNGNTADFRKFARAGITSGNYNERALKYLNYLNGDTSRSLATAIKKAQSSGVENVFNLFSNGEQGAWYEPWDLTTLYQDAEGKTPVTADGDPVGLMLDKSQGLTLGPELFTSDFSAFSQTEDGWTITATSLVCDGVDDLEFAFIGGLLPATNGYYEIELTIENYVSGGLFISISNGKRDSMAFASNGTYKVRAYDTNNDPNNRTFYLRSEFFSGKVTHLSVKEIRTSPAIQSASASRRLYKTNGSQSWLLDDLVDDGINAQLPDLGTNATLAYADGSGVTILTGQTISGATPLPTAAETYGAIYLDRPLSAGETESVTAYLSGLRGA